MITANFFYNNSQKVHAFELTEHAYAGEPGEDLVCAAVSAITFGLTNAILSLDESELEVQQEDGGYLSVKNIPGSEAAQTLLYGMIISLNTIEESDDNFRYITVIENDKQ